MMCFSVHDLGTTWLNEIFPKANDGFCKLNFIRVSNFTFLTDIKNVCGTQQH